VAFVVAVSAPAGRVPLASLSRRWRYRAVLFIREITTAYT
jgi:hypothetical protein